MTFRKSDGQADDEANKIANNKLTLKDEPE